MAFSCIPGSRGDGVEAICTGDGVGVGGWGVGVAACVSWIGVAAIVREAGIAADCFGNGVAGSTSGGCNFVLCAATTKTNVTVAAPMMNPIIGSTRLRPIAFHQTGQIATSAAHGCECFCAGTSCSRFVDQTRTFALLSVVSG